MYIPGLLTDCLTCLMLLMMKVLSCPPAICYLATVWGGGGDLTRRGLEQKMAV